MKKCGIKEFVCMVPCVDSELRSSDESVLIAYRWRKIKVKWNQLIKSNVFYMQDGWYSFLLWQFLDCEVDSIIGCGGAWAWGCRFFI